MHSKIFFSSFHSFRWQTKRTWQNIRRQHGKISLKRLFCCFVILTIFHWFFWVFESYLFWLALFWIRHFILSFRSFTVRLCSVELLWNGKLDKKECFFIFTLFSKIDCYECPTIANIVIFLLCLMYFIAGCELNMFSFLFIQS